MLTIGDGIAVGCAIIVTGIVLWKFFSRGNPGNPGNSGKHVLQKVCDANVQSMNQQLAALNKLMTDGFNDLRESIREVHKRVDRALMKRDNE